MCVLSVCLLINVKLNQQEQNLKRKKEKKYFFPVINVMKVGIDRRKLRRV